MGKIRNKLIEKVSNAVATRKTSKKQLGLSIVSLILASAILVSATYCWYALAKGEGKTNNINLTTGNGLRVNDLGNTSKKFKDDSFLYPASSVDGRNLFFPTDGTDFSSETSKMTFRSANAGDRNYDYVQLDFTLTAEANYTGIYLDKSTSLKIDVPSDASSDYKAAAAKAEKAIRTAIYYDRMDKPVVFTSQMNPCSLEAVKDIDRTTGRCIEKANQLAVPFKDYFYGKKQLAMLNQGETRPFSLIIWFEGTDEVNCVSNYIMLKQLVLNLKFTTTWDNTVEINFEDVSTSTGTDEPEYNVAKLLSTHPEYSLVLNYNNTSHKIYDLKYTMQKAGNDQNDFKKWKCNIPGNAYNDLSFQILDGANNNSLVCEWRTNKSNSSTLDRGTATTYYADLFKVSTVTQGENTRYDYDISETPRGHWHDGDVEDHGGGHDGGLIYDDDW